MPILTGKEILDGIDKGLITNHDKNRVSTCSYDLAVGRVFRDGKVIGPNNPPAHQQIIVAPGEVVTLLTAEELHLPNNVAATAYAMNSQSSEGFLVLNPGHVDPGYEGPLEIKAINLRKVPFALTMGDPVFTVVFDRLSKSTSGYNKNKPLEETIRAVRKKEVELTVRTIGDLVAENGPFPTRDEVSKMIRDQLNAWLMNAVIIITMIAAIIAAYPIVRDFLNKDTTDIATQTPNAGLPSTNEPQPENGVHLPIRGKENIH
jgi:deoxycytidine triphosphate deaminase